MLFWIFYILFAIIAALVFFALFYKLLFQDVYFDECDKVADTFFSILLGAFWVVTIPAALVIYLLSKGVKHYIKFLDSIKFNKDK